MERNVYQAWQAAGITNDFIFNAVMQRGNNCRDLLQAILPELGIQTARWRNTQQEFKDTHRQKGVRFDVFASDEHRRVYDIEMQVTRQTDMGRRIRYYQSKIDMNSLEQGKAYDQINPSFVIFLCPFDPLGTGRRRYTFHLHCDEDLTIGLNTAATVILLNSRGHLGRVSPELQNFFALMNGQPTVSTNFGRKLIKDIRQVKMDPKQERDFMDLAMKMYDERQEGQKEGQRLTLIKLANKWQKQGLANQQIKVQLHDLFDDQVSSQEIDHIVDQLH